MTSKTTKRSSTTALELVFQHWATMAELQLEYIEKLGAYKLNVAQADLVRAVAAGQWAVARMKADVVMELEQSLARLGRLRYQTRRRQQRLQRQARDIARIRNGADITSSQLARMWAAYTVFERAIPADVMTRLLDTELDPRTLRGSDYFDVRHPERSCPDVPPRVNNVLALIGWMRRHRFVPRRGSVAYKQIIAAFYEIGAVARTQSERLQSALQQLEKRTYDAWKPIAIAALPDSVDVKRITRVGVR